MESRTHLDVSLHENSSTPTDGPKVVIPVIAKFDMDPIAMTIASLTCHVANRHQSYYPKHTDCNPHIVNHTIYS